MAWNSLFLGEIGLPDWDMFQSRNAAASLHACLRAVGGCGVYVSDHPGEHNFDILKRIALPSGHTLRALFPGRPTRDCLFRDVGMDGDTALKIWNANLCGGVVGAFNVQGSSWRRDKRMWEIQPFLPLSPFSISHPLPFDPQASESPSSVQSPSFLTVSNPMFPD